MSDAAEARALSSRPIEWPTIGLAVAIYAAWLATTLCFRAIPPPLLFVIGGWLTAWHGSLQHEAIHGHPTTSRRFNALLAAAPLSLWLPFDLYRRSHLQHHAAEQVTDPDQDPESRYLGPRIGSLARLETGLARVQGPLLGRLLIGPPLEILRSLTRDAVAMLRGNSATLQAWAWHAAGLVPVLWWLHSVCGLPLLIYGPCFVYPGTALLLLRSFAEHRADPLASRRVAIVERAPLLGLLFLNNNLHAAHHSWPGATWYLLPGLYRRHRPRLLRENGGLLYSGYADVVRRFLLRPHDQLDHARALGAGPAK